MGARRTVAVIMGTRPEGIKMAPVIAALQGADDLACRVVATGQHREMFQQVAEQFRCGQGCCGRDGGLRLTGYGQVGRSSGVSWPAVRMSRSGRR